MTLPPVEWQRVRGVVFDLDGTLYDQRSLRLRMARELALRCLARPSTVGDARILSSFRRRREELAEEEARGITRQQYERPAGTLGLPTERVERVVREWILERPLRHLEPCRPPGVRRLFTALQAGGRSLAIWSDYPAAAKLDALGLFADVVVTAEDPEVDCLKPLPDGLDRALQLLGLAPGEALMIGDRDERDGEAARRLGCPYLLWERRASGPHRFRSHEELLASLPRPGRATPVQ